MPSAIFPFTVRDRLGPLGTKSEGSGTSGSLQAVSFLYNGLVNNTRGEDCFTNNKEHGGISVMKNGRSSCGSACLQELLHLFFKCRSF